MIIETLNKRSFNYSFNRVSIKDMSKIPWVDKYRPSSIDGIVYQDDAKKFFNNVLRTGELPHTLLYGPPGTGKTTIILALAINLFGPEKISERVIELNASDDRGIGIVRDTIIGFSQKVIGTPDPNYPSPPFKIIILDEADAMTQDAQSALRKVMEDHSSITRFCFICNYIDQIIDPIKSRCVVFRFKPLSDSYMKDRLDEISIKENLVDDIEDDVIGAIIETSNGDLRKAIMQLQGLKYSIKMKGSKLNRYDILEINNLMPDYILKGIIDRCIDNGTKVKDLISIADDILSMSFPVGNVIKQIHNEIMIGDVFDDIKKIKIGNYLYVIDGNLRENASEQMSLIGVLGCLYSVWRDIDCCFNP